MDDGKAPRAGATWWRCALQVAPWGYLASNNKPDPYQSETAYNDAIIEAAASLGIEVLGFADHWRIRSSEVLLQAATDAGLTCLPGFEATTKDGIHLLVHFDPDTEFSEIERRISECGVDPATGTTESGNLYFEEMLGRVAEWGAVCTAAHVTNDAGLLKATTGRRRQDLWRNELLHSVALSYRQPSQEYAGIIRNTDPQYSRRHPPAVIYAADVASHESLSKDSASTWIKMVRPTARGLDLAFRSPETRISLEDPTGQNCLAVESVKWSGGFLDELSLSFNPDLNVLIGGRGTGKSTIVESLRAVLGRKPLTDRALVHHEEMLSDAAVLGRGTKIEVTLNCVTPSPHKVRIERVLPSEAALYDVATGARLARNVDDVAGGIDVYGQRELAEIADDPELRTDLLRRFLPNVTDREMRETEARAELSRTAREILDVLTETDELDQQLATQPSLEERLRLFTEAGVAGQLAAQARHQTEDQLLSVVEQRVASINGRLDALDVSASLSRSFLQEQSGDELPDASLLEKIQSIFDGAFNRMVRAAAELEDASFDMARALGALRDDWNARSAGIEREFSRVQRHVQSQGADAGEYLTVRRQVETLRQTASRRSELGERLVTLRDQRLTALVMLESTAAEELRRLQRVGRRLSGKLDGLVRVSVSSPDDRSPVMKLIRSRVSGRLDKVEEWLRHWPEFSPRALADLARSGMEKFAETAGVSLDQAQRVAGAPEDLLLGIEELELTPRTDIELNIGAQGSPVWRPLNRLSTGQKATALLLLLMLEEQGPLIIDQPEDDLDNQFIYAGIVPRLRGLKGKRQLIFASHNANIPVLGDAELISVMNVHHDSDVAAGVSPPEHRGSIDEPRVRELVEELLEGGRKAFEIRRYRYGL